MNPHIPDIEIRDCLARNDVDALRKLCEEEHPALIAEYLADFEPTEMWAFLALLDRDTCAEIFSHLHPDTQIELAENLTKEQLASLVTEMPPDDRVDLLKQLPEEQVNAIMPAIDPEERADIRRLSGYAENTAGAIMTSDFITLPAEATAEQCIDKLRREASDKETIYYAYVLDAHEKLIGFVSLRDLILAHPAARVTLFMHHDPISVQVTEDQEVAARMVQKYDLIALPVVDEQERLVGMITHDDAFDVISQEQTEDLEKLMGITGEHENAAYMRTSPWQHFRKRVGWVIALAALGLVAGFIVEKFGEVIATVAILVTFMPMLADTGGNTGSQSATLVVRGLAIGEIRPRDIMRVLFKELLVALPLGLVLGVLAFGRVVLFTETGADLGGNSMTIVGLAIALALALQVVSATLFGAILPMAAAGLKLDPALVASPALTTVVDITGLLIFFTTVKIMLGL